MTRMRGWVRGRVSGDAGVGTLEYVGVVTIAAILIAAVLLSTSSLQVREHVAAWSCRIMEAFGEGGGCGPVPSAERAPEDYIPQEPCVVSARGGETSAAVTVVVTLEGGERWLIERLGDETHRLTRIEDGGVGIGVGVGFDLSVTNDNETYGVGATAQADAAIVVGEGESYIARTEEEARRILDHKRNDATKDMFFGDDNLVRDGADWVNELFGGSNEFEQLEPDEWFVEAGIESQASAGVTAIVGTAEAEATLDAYLGTTERKDGTATDYLRAAAGISGGFEGHGVTSAGYDTYNELTIDGSMESILEIDRDADGEPVAFRLRSVTMWNPVRDQSFSGAGGIDADPEYVERVVEIPLQSAADRRLATRVMHTLGIPYYPGVTDRVDVSQTVLDRVDPVGLGRELGTAAADRGYLYEQTYTTWSTEDAVNAQGKVGVSLGLNITGVENGRSTTGYRYYDGTGMVDRAGCTVDW